MAIRHHAAQQNRQTDRDSDDAAVHESEWIDISARCRRAAVAAGVQLRPLWVGVGLRRNLGVRRVGSCVMTGHEVRCAEERVRDGDPNLERRVRRALIRDHACAQEILKEGRCYTMWFPAGTII